jgi:hypothetical protein
VDQDPNRRRVSQEVVLAAILTVVVAAALGILVLSALMGSG